MFFTTRYRVLRRGDGLYKVQKKPFILAPWKDLMVPGCGVNYPKLHVSYEEAIGHYQRQIDYDSLAKAKRRHTVVKLKKIRDVKISL